MFPRLTCCEAAVCSGEGSNESLTNLSNDLVIFQNAPGDVDAVIVPVRPWHMRVYIGIHARHLVGDLLDGEMRPQLGCSVKLRRAG